MEIQYTYKVVAVDEAAKCMEVLYEASGRQPQHIGAPLPVEGEKLADVISMYAPLAYWRSQEKKTVSVVVGESGSSAELHVPSTLQEAKELKLIKLAYERYNSEVAGITIDGMMYDTSRVSQQQILATNALLQSGQIEAVTWKTISGMFIPHDAASFSTVASAVVSHVQGLFSTECELAKAVTSATSIEAVEQITWPL